MFRVIKLDGKIELIDQVNFVLAYEYIQEYDVTLLYCFCKSRLLVNAFYDTIKTKYNSVLLPETYHDAYLKNYYYDEILIICSNKKTIKLFQNLKWLESNYIIFFETKVKRKRINERIEFTSINELKTILIENYQIKYVIPFFYSIREMKEYLVERRTHIKDINLLFVLENKTLEGKKR